MDEPGTDGVHPGEIDLTRLARLEAAVADLQATGRDEVRARRLVVVDESGEERVVVSARVGHASVLVRSAGTGPPATTGAELYAVDPLDGDGAEVGLAVVVGGEVLTTLSWLDDATGPEG